MCCGLQQCNCHLGCLVGPLMHVLIPLWCAVTRTGFGYSGAYPLCAGLEHSNTYLQDSKLQFCNVLNLPFALLSCGVLSARNVLSSCAAARLNANVFVEIRTSTCVRADVYAKAASGHCDSITSLGSKDFNRGSSVHACRLSAEPSLCIFGALISGARHQMSMIRSCACCFDRVLILCATVGKLLGSLCQCPLVVL